MKCPHCNYAHREEYVCPDNPRRIEYSDGEHGAFYELPVRLARHAVNSRRWEDETVSMHACPVCMRTFVE